VYKEGREQLNIPGLPFQCPCFLEKGKQGQTGKKESDKMSKTKAIQRLNTIADKIFTKIERAFCNR